jgi:hypothetical protein
MDNPQSHIFYLEDHKDTRELVTLVLADSNCRVTLPGEASRHATAPLRSKCANCFRE